MLSRFESWSQATYISGLCFPYVENGGSTPWVPSLPGVGVDERRERGVLRTLSGAVKCGEVEAVTVQPEPSRPFSLGAVP